jgi:hypothetical protein
MFLSTDPQLNCKYGFLCQPMKKYRTGVIVMDWKNEVNIVKYSVFNYDI